MTTKPNIQAAKTLGAIAYAKGIMRAPALDGDLVAWFVGRPIEDKRTIPEMKAWLSGWDQANLAANRAA